jgi:hypothetical protein
MLITILRHCYQTIKRNEDNVVETGKRLRTGKKKKVISVQAVEALRVARG